MDDAVIFIENHIIQGENECRLTNVLMILTIYPKTDNPNPYAYICNTVFVAPLLSQVESRMALLR
jgi:hypothetical protein